MDNESCRPALAATLGIPMGIATEQRESELAYLGGSLRPRKLRAGRIIEFGTKKL